MCNVSKLANQCIGKVNWHGMVSTNSATTLDWGIWVFYIIKINLNMNCCIINLK